MMSNIAIIKEKSSQRERDMGNKRDILRRETDSRRDSRGTSSALNQKGRMQDPLWNEVINDNIM